MRQRGFTLIEVIVATALLALGLTLLLGSLTGAVRQVRGAEDAGRVALHAQSLLAQVGVGAPLEPGEQNGSWDEGRYRWQLQVRPFRDPAQRGDAPVAAGSRQLMELVLQVRWDQQGQAAVREWRGLRLVKGPESLPGAAR
ncbi:type II secretion system protein XpsI [Pseudoxanthomonas composti]|uniref:Prepilin-type N-terminal cleavage/methylation domain-containing protein n=1 Tax=Pseudoxanthomonas composti TaxID=2137479 RepID=A0A4Q1JTA4_9GAMM|nr:prepilin-type N-terminal cleavage/methylation domain-containing protein [Pseudoxanthomonas composti]RXR01387.1 prepilin-type N-terminal cleavage/methylation domain-containing protein [Pseudoxanthomonas composti]